MKKKILFAGISLLATFHLTSCSQKEMTEPDTHPILKIGSVTATSLNDFCASVEFIPLETNEESLIKGMKKIVLFEDKYFIFDKEMFSIFIFDKDGRFVTKIHRIGQGPGEYTFVYDFNVNKEKRRIELLVLPQRVLSYDFDGNFIEMTQLPSPPLSYFSFECTNDSAYLFYTVPYFDEERPFIHLSGLNAKQHEYNAFMFHDPAVALFGIYLYKYNDEVYLSNFISDNIYRFVDTSYVVAYEWDFGHRMNDFMKTMKSTPETFNKIVPEYIDIFNANEKNHARISCFEADRYYYTHISQGRMRRMTSADRNYKPDSYNVFYEKETGKYHYFKQTEEGCQFKVLHAGNDYCVGYIDSECMPDILERRAVENIDVFENWKEDDNPILIKMNFK